MSSTEHSRSLICRKCGQRDTVRVLAMCGREYVCECACGHVYYSKSNAAGAEYARRTKFKNQ
ncbi:hypothetical protein SP40_117 [Salmonella phage 40]|nr:hypothetical protein SP40_117 [Salmonella phage 40]